MSRDLRARLGASRVLLARVYGDALANASRLQAQGFVAVAKTASLSAEERADLSSFASEAGFADDDLAAILESLAPRIVVKAKKKNRRPMQFFEAFVNYFTEEEWTAMQNSDASLLEIRQIIFQRVFALGGRCPSEGTKRLMACLILMLTHDMKIPIVHREKTSTLESVRCAWSVFARRSSPPPEHIEKLPSSPFVYQRQYARLHGLAYVHGATPIPCRLNPLSLEALSQTFGCRGNKESAPMLRLASRESSSASLAPMLRLGDDSLDGMARCFVEELRRQGERQDRMMEMLLNHQNQQRPPLMDTPALMDTPGGKRMRCEQELCTFSRAGSRRLSVSPRDERDGDGLADSVFDEPVDSAAEGSAAVQASPAAAALALAGDESSAAAPPAATGEGIALLDALEQRDAKRKIAAKVAKAQAAALAKAQALAAAKLAAERAAVPSASAAQPAAEPTDSQLPKAPQMQLPSGAEALAPDSQLPKEPPVQQKGQAKRSKKAAKRSKKAAAPKASPLAPAAEVPAAAPKASPLAPAAEVPPAVVSATASIAELALAAGMQEIVTLNIERTRTQALVRVGKAPKQRCKQFKWGEKTWHKYRTEEAATQAARAWIATGCKPSE